MLNLADAARGLIRRPRRAGTRLSPARRELAASIAALEAARVTAERATAPVDRLRSIIEARETAEAELVEVSAPHSTATGEYLAAGSVGPRPEPPPAMQAAEKRLSELLKDADSAADLLPTYLTAAEDAQTRLRIAEAQRDEAARQVALEAVKEMVARELLPSLRRVLACEQVLLGVRDELRGMGLPYAGAVLVDLLASTVRSKGLARDTLAWRRLADALSAPPAGALVAEALLQGLRDYERASDSASARRFLDALAADAGVALHAEAA